MADWFKQIFELSDVRLLLYLSKKRVARYSELLESVIESRSTLATSLLQLQKMKLILREVKATRPIRTEYTLTAKGEKVVEMLSALGELLRN